MIHSLWTIVHVIWLLLYGPYNIGNVICTIFYNMVLIIGVVIIGVVWKYWCWYRSFEILEKSSSNDSWMITSLSEDKPCISLIKAEHWVLAPTTWTRWTMIGADVELSISCYNRNIIILFEFFVSSTHNHLKTSSIDSPHLTYSTCFQVGNQLNAPDLYWIAEFLRNQ